MRTDPDKITLGSGKAYIAEYNAETGIPAETEICKPENLLGKIKGGAELTYTTETHEEKDDLGTVAKVVITAEEALLKLGLITFNGKTMTLVSLEKGGSAIGYVVNGYLLTEIITTPTYNDESQILIGGNAEKRIVTTLMILLIALTITISLLFIESKLLFKKE